MRETEEEEGKVKEHTNESLVTNLDCQERKHVSSKLANIQLLCLGSAQ